MVACTPYKPSEQQLKAALHHIYYEIQQLIGTLLRMENVVINNALVESRLLHVRNLLYFFEKRSRTCKCGRELDDVLSSDYGFTPKNVKIPQKYRSRLNKDLAHLAYSRTERLPEEKHWPHDEVIVPILECSKKFVKKLIEDYLPNNLPSQLGQWENLLKQIENLLEM